MDFWNYFLEIELHLDKYIVSVVNTYQEWTYLILFLIIFCETGIIIAAFLPGDALLFTTGTLAAIGGLNLWLLLIILTVAAYLGDTLNYKIGEVLRGKLLEKDYALIKRKHLVQTQQFYILHGGKTIIIARFLPVIRTFAPFIAGASKMKYSKFLTFNIIGAILWINSCILLGYFFGNLPLIQDNFSLLILAIVIITTPLPIFINYLMQLRTKRIVNLSKKAISKN